jgi:SAM-dependent methyltransferase
MAGNQDYRELSLNAWSTVADGWERRRAELDSQHRLVSEALVEALAPEPGQTILELAAGLGDVGYDALAGLGEDGRLITTDFAPEMVEAARRRAEERGLANVEHRVMDAEAMDLDDDSVDGVVCRFGYMLMADPAQALRETRRVLRPGGRLAFATWAPPDRNPALAVMGAALMTHGHVPPPEPGAPGIFAIPTAERATELARGAGFETVDVREVPVAVEHASLDAWWAYTRDIAGPFTFVIEGLSDAQAAEVQGSIREWAAAWETDGRYELPGAALVTLAR